MVVDAEGNPVLKGPVNRRVYASFAPKRHAFAIARREADRRGFTRNSGKPVQIVMDGDEDLERYAREFFPEAILTLDVYHAIEYLWTAGRSLHRRRPQSSGGSASSISGRLSTSIPTARHRSSVRSVSNPRRRRFGTTVCM